MRLPSWDYYNTSERYYWNWLPVRMITDCFQTSLNLPCFFVVALSASFLLCVASVGIVLPSLCGIGQHCHPPFSSVWHQSAVSSPFLCVASVSIVIHLPSLCGIRQHCHPPSFFVWHQSALSSTFLLCVASVSIVLPPLCGISQHCPSFLVWH